MAEVQKKHAHENRNAVIFGFLLTLLPVIILLLFLYLIGAFSCKQPPETANSGMDTVYCSLCPSLIFLIGLLPTIYLLIYLPIGILLYLASLKFDKENRLQLRLWGKSLIAGALIGIALLFIQYNYERLIC